RDLRENKILIQIIEKSLGRFCCTTNYYLVWYFIKSQVPNREEVMKYLFHTNKKDRNTAIMF
ncbi:MAG: hypothetical protein ACOYMQ_04675, partial [Pseudanabaena sp.]